MEEQNLLYDIKKVKKIGFLPRIFYNILDWSKIQMFPSHGYYIIIM